MLRVGIPPGNLAHFFRKIYNHLIMEAPHSLHGVDVIQLLNIKIAHAVCLFQFHSPLFTQTGNHGCCYHKMILYIYQGIS